MGFDSPSEYFRGAPPDSALAVFPPAFADGSGPPLLEFLVPTAFQSQVPRSSAIGVTDRGRRELPSSRRCRPRALSAPRRFELPAPFEPELPRARPTRAFPKTCAALFHAADALGIFPTELSPLEEPCCLPTAVVLPCGFSDSTATSDAKAPGISRPVSPRRRPRAAPRNPRKGLETRRRRRDRGSSRSLGHLSTTVTRSNLGSRPASFGLAGSQPDRPLRSLAPSENPFTQRPCGCSSLRPYARAAPGPLLSWDYAPLKLAPPRPRVSVDCESARRAVKP